jgi:hypothetical protein
MLSAGFRLTCHAWITYTTVLSCLSNLMLVSNMTALGTELLRDLGTLSKGTVRVASGRVTGLSGTVGGVAALGSDLLELVLGQVGEVCGVGGGHCVEW